MPFFYDRVTGLSGPTQYNNYVDNELYLYDLHRDVKDITNYQLIEVRRAISKSSGEVQRSINDSVGNVCGTLEYGFNEIATQLYAANEKLDGISQGIDDINWSLTDINQNIDDLNNNIVELRGLFDWKTDLIIEQHRLSNNYLSTIAESVHMSNEEKRNITHKKRGNTLLMSAVAEGTKSNFYSDALIEFEEALKDDRTDFMCLRQLGIIYLNSKDVLNIEKAEACFGASARYALAYYKSDGYKSDEELAGTSFYYQSYCNYILDKPAEALSQIKKAIDISPNDLKYKFRYAKFLAAFARPVEAANILREIIRKEKLYSIEILKDQDMITKPEIQNMLNEETAKEIKEVEFEIARIKRIVFDSRTSLIIESIERAFNPKNYLTARETKTTLGIE